VYMEIREEKGVAREKSPGDQGMGMRLILVRRPNKVMGSYENGRNHWGF